jgi:pyridoxine/pyridoxamine 5'-phosphate oxidase
MTTHHAAEVAKLAEKIKHVRFPMFTWQDQHGHLLSQPMTQQQVDDEGGIWFYTSTLTSLWDCIAHRPQVNLGFAHQDDSLYVSVSGTAERVVDRERIRAIRTRPNTGIRTTARWSVSSPWPRPRSPATSPTWTASTRRFVLTKSLLSCNKAAC